MRLKGSHPEYFDSAQHRLSRRVNGLLSFVLALTVVFVGCGLLNKKLDENQKMVISELAKISKEDLFSPGANNWDGYTGCKNKLEKRAYADNITKCINNLKNQVEDSMDTAEFENIISQYEKNAEVLEEEFRADTDESEIRWMYFSRIRKIVGV